MSASPQRFEGICYFNYLKPLIMSQLFYGSICITDVIDLLKSKHSAFTKGKNGKIYGAINVWENDEPDQYGNTLAIQLNPTQERKEQDKKPYIGNCKKSEGAKPVNDKDVAGIDIPSNLSEDLPF